MLQPILLVAAGLVVLVLGAEFMVRGASRLAVAMGLSSLFVGLTIVAFATSSPELVVSIRAALHGSPDLAVGNLVGSNICNVAVILGITALVTPIPCRITVIRREVPIVIVATGLFWYFARGGLDRTECLILVGGLALYTTWAYLLVRSQPRDEGFDPLARGKGKDRKILLNLVLIAVGLTGLILGGRWLVDGAQQIALELGWSETVIGLTVVAVGTSLPEVATSVIAAIRKEPDLAVGNVMGSSLWNLLGVAGMAGLIDGLPVEDDRILLFDVPVALGLALACLPIMGSNRRISRGEGVFLLVSYAAYLLVRLTWFRT